MRNESIACRGFGMIAKNLCRTVVLLEDILAQLQGKSPFYKPDDEIKL